jgi:hypothetical protein
MSPSILARLSGGISPEPARGIAFSVQSDLSMTAIVEFSQQGFEFRSRCGQHGVHSDRNDLFGSGKPALPKKIPE